MSQESGRTYRSWCLRQTGMLRAAEIQEIADKDADKRKCKGRADKKKYKNTIANKVGLDKERVITVGGEGFDTGSIMRDEIEIRYKRGDSTFRDFCYFSCCFIIMDKAKRELGGNYQKGCRGSERQRAKAGGCPSLAHTRCSRGRGYLRKGKSIRGERFVSGMGECVSVKL